MRVRPLTTSLNTTTALQDAHLHELGEHGDSGVHSGTGLNEKDDLARLTQRLDELLGLLVPLEGKVTLSRSAIDGGVYFPGRSVADGHGEAVASHVQGKVLPHNLQEQPVNRRETGEYSRRVKFETQTAAALQ